MAKRITCECGFIVNGQNDQELLANAHAHTARLTRTSKVRSKTRTYWPWLRSSELRRYPYLSSRS
jgi:hypothetical protein